MTDKIATTWEEEVAKLKWKPLNLSAPWFDSAVYKWARVSVIADNQYYDGSAMEIGTFDIDAGLIREQWLSTGQTLFTQVCVLGLGSTTKETHLHVRFNLIVNAQGWISIIINSPNPLVNPYKIYIKEE